MADLLTEPRWYRAHEVFTEDADLNSNIMKSLVEGLQGSTIKDGTSVNADPRCADHEALPGRRPARAGHGPALFVWQVPAVRRQRFSPTT
jgi:beta-glucosidase